MKQAGSYNYTLSATLFTLSDIGLSLYRFPGEMELFAQSLASGVPLADVMLDEKGRQLASGVSDGHLCLPAQAKGKLLLATQKGQTSMIDLNLPALALAEFPVAGLQGYDKQLFVFSPRGLYRPGETVIVNALLRNADGKPLSAQPLKAKVVQPNGERRLMIQSWSDDSFGAAERKVVVTAPLISELATPRFMASSGQAMLALDLTNLTDQPQSLKVEVQTQGLLGSLAGCSLTY